MPGTACPAESAGTPHKMRRHSGENPSKTRTLVAHSLFSGVPGCLTLPEKDAKSRPARYVFPFLSFPKEAGRPICRKIPVHGTGSRPLIWPHPWPPAAPAVRPSGQLPEFPVQIPPWPFSPSACSAAGRHGRTDDFLRSFPAHTPNRPFSRTCVPACMQATGMRQRPRPIFNRQSI